MIYKLKNGKSIQKLTTTFRLLEREATCKAYYEQKRWDGTVACPHCGSLKFIEQTGVLNVAKNFVQKSFLLSQEQFSRTQK